MSYEHPVYTCISVNMKSFFDPNTHCKSSFFTVFFILSFHHSFSFIPNYKLLLLPNNNQKKKSPEDIMRNRGKIISDLFKKKRKKTFQT